MNILVLGGTQFSGRAFVEQADAAGHQVTVLHRSKEDPGLASGVRRLVGDRDPEIGDGLDQIHALIDGGERFDAVVDMCGYVPRVVRASCELLRDAVDQYVFISTISVYDREGVDSLDEDSKLIELDDPTIEEINGETYGGLKVLCERVINETIGNKACIVRPGVIAGPNDPTDRFTWWTRVLANEAAVVFPKEPAGLTQFIDARDLAGFFLRCIEKKTLGVYNAVGPEDGLQSRDFVDRARAALNSTTELIEREPQWLSDHGVELWAGLPAMLPKNGQTMHRVSCDRALGAGLSRRPLEETVVDTRAWDVARGEPELAAGLSLEKLREVCAAVDS